MPRAAQYKEENKIRNSCSLIKHCLSCVFDTAGELQERVCDHAVTDCNTVHTLKAELILHRQY